MKNQALFSSKDKSKKLKCRLLQLLFSALRVNTRYMYMEVALKASRVLRNYNVWEMYGCMPLH